jgi:uncharacterized protein (DUF305 family)
MPLGLSLPIMPKPLRFAKTMYLILLMSRLLAIALIMLNILASYPLSAQADPPAVSDALNQAMTSMNVAMSSFPMTGNPDIDFAVMMIPHHQGAIEMAKVELQYGTDSRLRRLAQEIIVTQQSEVTLMQLALEHLSSP